MDMKRLRHELAMQSAVVSTLLEQQADSSGSIPQILLDNYLSAYSQYCMMDVSTWEHVAEQMRKSECLTVNVAASLKKDT